MNRWLCVLAVALMVTIALNGCASAPKTAETTPTTSESEIHVGYDTRVTGATAAAHCLNNITTRAGVTSKNWKKTYRKECGQGAENYLAKPQFKEFLTEKSNQLLATSLAE